VPPSCCRCLGPPPARARRQQCRGRRIRSSVVRRVIVAIHVRPPVSLRRVRTQRDICLSRRSIPDVVGEPVFSPKPLASGRDSNPDTVVQRSVRGFWSASFRNGLLRFSRPRLKFASLRFGAISCRSSLVSHLVETVKPSRIPALGDRSLVGERPPCSTTYLRHARSVHLLRQCRHDGATRRLRL